MIANNIRLWADRVTYPKRMDISAIPAAQIILRSTMRGVKMKTCTKCNQTKSLLCFFKHRNDCKLCCSEYQKNHRKTEQAKAVFKNYYPKHKQNVKRYHQTEKGRIVCIKASQRFRINHPERVKATKERYCAQYPNRSKARHALNHAISMGKLPPVKTLQCHYCPKQAQQYHHYKGYAKENWLEVLPACVSCHKKEHVSKHLFEA